MSCTIEVVYAAAPHDVRMRRAGSAEGAVLADALRASGLLTGLSAEAADALQAGVWGTRRRSTRACATATASS